MSESALLPVAELVERDRPHVLAAAKAGPLRFAIGERGDSPTPDVGFLGPDEKSQPDGFLIPAAESPRVPVAFGEDHARLVEYALAFRRTCRVFLSPDLRVDLSHTVEGWSFQICLRPVGAWPFSRRVRGEGENLRRVRAAVEEMIRKLREQVS